ncbi:growth-regulating factor 4 [Phtheirospermum japonicum]|uniref:Growth-regulating factor n=1 Tax=Phtheirospermum japonicum TaxID=374723 RepID=A0A830BMN7_9LAMI|nr:growth-regulating factor 4 [Phtheirospermum japonicum]
MDFNLKQWRDESEQEEEQDQKPKLLLNSHPHSSSSSSSSAALPLFFSEPNSNLSVPYSSEYHHPNMPSANKFPKNININTGMGSYFSTSQWQELELQALIFRHMIAGAVIPTELLHLVKKSLINSPYYQYYPHYQPALLQSGYWGRAGMDPEPGRCRRTDGKKWRCSRDVVAGQKYCERHVHRGRNRSRKPVENTTSAAGAPYVGGGSALKTNCSAAGRGVAAGGDGGGGSSCFTLTTSSHSTDLLHMNQRSCESIIETNDGQSSGRTLRHFFDDWSKPLHETDNAASYSATNLSISMPGNSSSDFSLKLGTGVGEEPSTQVVSGERDDNNNNSNSKPQLNWGGMAWENNSAAPMGGPLAEALRSSMSNSSSPTSVLHRLQRGNVSETSYVTL